MRVICYGDSNTYGYDPRSYLGEQYPKNIRWTGILDESPEFDVDNYGMNGRSIPHTASALKIFSEQINRWSEEKDSVLLVMLGTNDLLQNVGFSAENVASRMEMFLHEHVEKMNMLLIAPPKLQYGAWVDDKHLYRESRRLGDCYQKVAETLNIHFLNLGIEDIPVVFDGVHLSEKGHRKVAEKIRLKLSEISS